MKAPFFIDTNKFKKGESPEIFAKPKKRHYIKFGNH